MKHFFSCDWGTSSFRLRLIETKSLKVLGAVQGTPGIAEVFHSWKQENSTEGREEFYLRVLSEHMATLYRNPAVRSLQETLKGVPILLSGMASSSIGILEIPYKTHSFSLDGSDLITRKLNGIPNHPVVLISGVSTKNDIMRGEETKVIGCSEYLTSSDSQAILLLPGTHPKHIQLKGNRVEDFKTYLTGELFNLLSEKSILAQSVQPGGDFPSPILSASFKEGVRESLQHNLLQSIFQVRSRQILNQVPPTENYYYLSGILIGTEVKDLNTQVPLYIVSAGIHTSLYKIACSVMGFSQVKHIDANEALIRGQRKILQRIFHQ